MTTNPFDSAEGTYLVLVNEEGRYSLWPAFLDVPDGWSTAQGEDTRQASQDFVARHWTDPKTIGVGHADRS